MAISSQGYFIFLYGHTKHSIHNWEGERKENKQTRTWVSSKFKNGEVCDTFVELTMHLWVSTGVYSSEIPTKPPGTLTHPLRLANTACESTGPSSRLSFLDYRLPSTSVDCLVLSSSLFCLLLFYSGTFLLTSSSGPVGNLAGRPFVQVSCQNRQRDRLIGTHTHRNEWHQSCHNYLFS